MVTESTTLTWQEALREFLLHLEAARARKTRLFYQVQLGRLVAWTEEQHIPIEQFSKRHLGRYLVDRVRAGLSPTTLHADALCAKAFLRWCVKNDILGRSLLAEYEIRKAPAPARYMPSEDEVRGLLEAVQDYWNPVKNADVRYHPHGWDTSCPAERIAPAVQGTSDGVPAYWEPLFSNTAAMSALRLGLGCSKISRRAASTPASILRGRPERGASASPSPCALAIGPASG